MSDRAKYLILIGAILAAVVGAALLAAPGSPIYRKPALGLDLQGGLEVILKAVPPKGQKVDANGMSTAQSIILSRIDKLGVSSPNVRKQGNDEIVVQLAGVHDPAKAAAIIGKTAQLQLFDFEADVTGPSVDSSGNPVATPSLYDLLTQVQKQAAKGAPEAYYLFKTKTVAATTKGAKATAKHSLVQGPVSTLKELLHPYRGHAPPDTQVLKVPAHTEVVSCAAATGCLGVQSTTATAGTYYYLLKYFPTRTTGAGPIPEMTGTDLVRGGTNADFGTGGEPIVTLQFTGHGSKEFQKITKAEAQRGQTKFDLAGKQGSAINYAQHFAIVLDQQIESTPYIDFTQNPDGIPGPSAEIDLNGGSFQEAKDLALVLQTGALPYNFVQIERTDVSATLGKSSLTQAWHAAIVGLVIVALLLLILYRFLGLVAVLGLGIYAALYYAAILLFNVTLTLPGFAGLILTIGVAADANVVVFERIKEEVRSGKSVRAAIATGYRRGFHTILDANVVTAITALVLFLIAVADVKGFALTLLIGTLISLLTAVAATRAMLGLLSGFKWFNNPRFMGAKAETIPRWQQIDVNSRGRRRVFLAIATVAIVASIFALVFKGLNLGIDFRGGTQMSFATKTAQPTSTVQRVFAADGFTDAVVQGRGKQSGNDFEQFQVRTKHLSNAQETRIVDDLTQQAGLTGTPDVNTVSSSFSSQIAHDAILAIIVSFLLIAIFISLRFQWRFAIPILRTLFNDILITLGVYALSGREVTIDTVAAILTVLGYSIYDTIIVFDRIRENMPLMRKASFPTIANISVAETLRRSITTSTLTLLPIAALYIFGGSTLKDFAFALLIGIGLGAVSTIFVATPFLTVLMEGSPEFKRRSADGTDGGFTGAAVPRQLLHALGRHTAEAEVAETAVEAEPEPELVEVTPPAPISAAEQARRERRKQRRRARPHGRAR
ncbi:MAG TPA: protein translocase subunit SecD [Gaiellaceae bacterium]|nr:protein translocase subunit SecD [Gaiellaceae bacterium]